MKTKVGGILFLAVLGAGCAQQYYKDGGRYYSFYDKADVYVLGRDGEWQSTGLHTDGMIGPKAVPIDYSEAEAEVRKRRVAAGLPVATPHATEGAGDGHY